ncbi:hypothetical protein KP509_13G040000 [Ceratopteris richardii]|uniref:CAF17 C-terminal domain-containing protein n=1 Tax=Ceratopteris richardii TaxID=49495 RepID=A0A8T2TF54_CERRI|nr:hypothetical protein KP509_13G040000 [Ceratopteris richardii]
MTSLWSRIYTRKLQSLCKRAEPTCLRHICSIHEDERSDIKERGPFASKLKTRGVVSIQGDDTFRFLQGLVTNDMRRFEQEPPPPQVATPTLNQPVAFVEPLYTALLNPQGRFLFDAFIYRLPAKDHRLNQFGSAPNSNGTPLLLCDIDADTADEFLEHLKKHRLRSKVGIEDMSKELCVWQRYGGSLMQESQNCGNAEVKSSGWGAASDPAAQASVEGDNEGYLWFKDPRNRALGYRGIFPSERIPPLVEADKEVDEIYYLLMRLELGVAEGCNEIQKEKAIPLEYNLEWLNAISFEKGCYVGQELIARTHNRGVVRKRIMPFKFVNDSGGDLYLHLKDVDQGSVPGAGAEILDIRNGKKVGDVTTVVGSRGLGMIRLEAAHMDMSQLAVKDVTGFHVKLFKPTWWPANWSPDGYNG